MKTTEIWSVTDRNHDWFGKRVIVARVNYELLGSINSADCELPEQQSLRYGQRLVCKLRPSQTEKLSDSSQRQTTNQMPAGFEAFRSSVTP